MPQIDLDDLPLRVAQTLSALTEGDELILVQGGAVVVRLAVAEHTPAAPAPDDANVSPEERMKDVMSQFNAMIHDEF